MKDNDEYELALFRNKKKRSITALLMVVVIMVAVVIIFYKGYTSSKEKYETIIEELEEEVERLSDPIAIYEEASREVDIRLINAEIQDISELATIEYMYTDAGKFEDPAEIFGKDIPFSFTTKSFIVKWDGIIKAGVDVSKVKAEVDGASKEIIVHIPEAEILSHEIDGESIETLNEKNGLFNKIKVEDVREFDAISKDAMEQRAIENGILDKAYNNAEEIIYKIINAGVVDELGYTITFEKIED